MATLQPVSSSAIDAAGYDPTAKELYLQWTGQSGFYTYHDVPQEVYDAFIAAPSQGKFANAVIKPGYSYSL